MKKTITYGKILLVLIASFFVVGFLSRQVFLANSPIIRPKAFQNVVNSVTYIAKSPIRLAVRIWYGPSVEEQLKNTPFTPIAPGVYAKQDEHLSLKEYKEDEVVWQSYTFTHNGKTYTIRYAKGDTLPDRKTLESLVE